MKPILPPILVSILIPFAFAQVSFGQSPPMSPAPAMSPTPASPKPELATKGTVVILDNDELIEGEITRTGDVCRIRRGSGETALPVSRVRAILNSRAEALATMRRGINPDNSLDHYKLAVWCYRHGMIAEAVASADRAVEISPKNQTFVRYAQAMKELAARPVAAAAPAPEAAKGAVAVLPDDFIADAWPSYLQKVQPILLNTCLECHNKDKGGSFQLERTSAENRRGSMANLVATLKQIDRKNPERSALVTKSITPHGGATLPPIRTWQPAVAKTLEEWTANAVQPSRTDPPKAPPAVAVRPVPIVPAPLSSPMPTVTTGLPASKDVPDLFPDGPKDKPTASVPFASDSKSQVEPAKKPEPIDPFDPDIFNGKVAPKK